MSQRDDSIQNGLVLRVCHGHSCGRDADEIEARIRREIAEKGLAGEVGVAREACFGRCFFGPNILVERWRDGRRNEQAMMQLMMMQKHPDMRWEHDVRAEDVPKIVRWHLKSWRHSQTNGE